MKRTSTDTIFLLSASLKALVGPSTIDLVAPTRRNRLKCHVTKTLNHHNYNTEKHLHGLSNKPISLGLNQLQTKLMDLF